MTKAQMQIRIKELEEQLAFWMGEGGFKTEEEREWTELKRLGPDGRTPEQTERIRELARFIMHADKSYWKQRAAKAEARLTQLDNF